MRLHHPRLSIQAALAFFTFCPLAQAALPAAPVPVHSTTITDSPQTPARAAAIKKWNDAKFGLFLHWGVYPADINTSENEIPHAASGGQCEYCWSMGAFWGYNPRNYTPDLLKTPEHYIGTLARIASLGGNYLLNVGPEPSGKLPSVAIDCLRKIGAWVNPNRAALEGGCQRPFDITPDWGLVTCREDKVDVSIRSGNATSPVTLPALKNRLLDSRLLLNPETEIETKPGPHEWIFGPIAGQQEGPFVIVELMVEATPIAAEQ